VLGGGDFSYRFALFDFSPEEVKQALVIGLIGFFLFIAWAAYGLWYLKQIKLDNK